MEKKYFGTDGIRGQVGVSPITPDFMLKLAWAMGKVLWREGKNRVVIGKDTRISGYMFESVLEAGLSAAGVDIFLVGPMPTPAIAYLTKTFHAQAGIVISASHNDYHDNGIKFFTPEGRKLSDEIEYAIEAQMDQPLTTVSSDRLGKAKRIDDAGGRYIEFCKNTFPNTQDLNGLKIVLDCANGATYQVAPWVFKELGAEVIRLSCEPNGLNINDNCGAVHPENLCQRVLTEQADLGIALDGDGDRLIMVDNKGEIIDGDEIVFILAAHLKPHGVVGTQMSNWGMELGLRERGIDFLRTKVGDRYIVEAMQNNGWVLGGESSGHIICRQFSNTGDGIVAALQVLATMMATERSLHELKNEMHKLPQEMINLKLNKIKQVLDNEKLNHAINKVEKKLAQKGRVLLRPSGTEPVMRVMVEGEDPVLIKQLVQELADEVRVLINA
jgi:phosphoglucosamine mutase